MVDLPLSMREVLLNPVSLSYDDLTFFCNICPSWIRCNAVCTVPSPSKLYKGLGERWLRAAVPNITDSQVRQYLTTFGVRPIPPTQTPSNVPLLTQGMTGGSTSNHPNLQNVPPPTSHMTATGDNTTQPSTSISYGSSPPTQPQTSEVPQGHSAQPASTLGGSSSPPMTNQGPTTPQAPPSQSTTTPTPANQPFAPQSATPRQPSPPPQPSVVHQANPTQPASTSGGSSPSPTTNLWGPSHGTLPTQIRYPTFPTPPQQTSAIPPSTFSAPGASQTASGGQHSTNQWGFSVAPGSPVGGLATHSPGFTLTPPQTSAISPSTFSASGAASQSVTTSGSSSPSSMANQGGASAASGSLVGGLAVHWPVFSSTSPQNSANPTPSSMPNSGASNAAPLNLAQPITGASSPPIFSMPSNMGTSSVISQVAMLPEMMQELTLKRIEAAISRGMLKQSIEDINERNRTIAGLNERVKDLQQQLQKAENYKNELIQYVGGTIHQQAVQYSQLGQQMQDDQLDYQDRLRLKARRNVELTDERDRLTKQLEEAEAELKEEELALKKANEDIESLGQLVEFWKNKAKQVRLQELVCTFPGF